MPSKSPAQHRLMEAAAHTKGGFGGVPQKVGKEFAKADKGKYATGGPALRPTVTNELRNAQFDADIAQAKSGDTRENSRAALDRLAARGVDLPGLVRGRLPLEAGNKENYKTGGGVSLAVGRKDSFCARMSGVVEHSKGDAPRAKASLKRWKCPGW